MRRPTEPAIGDREGTRCDQNVLLGASSSGWFSEPTLPCGRPIGMRPWRTLAATGFLVGAFLVAGCGGSSTGAGAGASPSPTVAGERPTVTGDGAPRTERLSAPQVRTIAKTAGGPPSGVAASFSTVLVVPYELVDAVLVDLGVGQLPRRDGEPLESGRYSDLYGSNDLAPGEVLAVWYSGQSGSCPSYLLGLRSTADGKADVERGPAPNPTSTAITTSTPNAPCSADYNPYRQLVVLSEEAVPAISDLPVTLEGEDGASDLVVDVYPEPLAP